MKTFNPFATSNFLLLHQIFRPFLPQIRLGLWNTASIWHTAVQSPLSGAVIDAHVSIQRYFLIANTELITVWVFFHPYWIVKLSHSYQATHELTNVFIPSCIWYLSLFIIFMGSTFTVLLTQYLAFTPKFNPIHFNCTLIFSSISVREITKKTQDFSKLFLVLNA